MSGFLCEHDKTYAAIRITFELLCCIDFLLFIWTVT